MNHVRQKKLMWVVAMLVGAIIAVGLILYAIRQQTDYYFDPSAIVSGQAPQAKRVRAGGMVVAGSFQRDPNDPVNIQFAITDYQSTVPVVYRGVLPDLFAENSGVVVTGELQGEVFMASEVLAKHDENYMPPEVAKSLKQDYETNGNNDASSYVPAIPVKQIDEGVKADASQ